MKKYYIIRYLFIAAVVSVLVVQLFSVATKKYRETRVASLLEQAQVALCNGDSGQYDRVVQIASRWGVNGTSVKLEALQQKASTIKNSLRDARAYYQSCGNTTQVGYVDKVLADYQTPKAMLQAAQELATVGQLGLAKQLIDRASKANPDYAGTKIALTSQTTNQ